MKTVMRLPGRRVQFGGESHEGWLPEGAAKPLPTPVQVIALDFRILSCGDSGYILEWSGPEAEWNNDTWHFSLAEAVDDAERTFGIGPDEWQDAEAG